MLILAAFASAFANSGFEFINLQNNIKKIQEHSCNLKQTNLTQMKLCCVAVAVLQIKNSVPAKISSFRSKIIIDKYSSNN